MDVRDKQQNIPPENQETMHDHIVVAENIFSKPHIYATNVEHDVLLNSTKTDFFFLPGCCNIMTHSASNLPHNSHSFATNFAFLILKLYISKRIINNHDTVRQNTSKTLKRQKHSINYLDKTPLEVASW